ncbi:MAG: ribonuclease J [Clostridia bacterium]|nr:ribonuclease J [Clostridia bacterium]
MAAKKTGEAKLRIVPLGGLGEIGKNMTVFEYGEDIIVVDIGSMFPSEDMPGVDLVIPDVTYLTKNASRIRAYIVTHGHEDHIGASPYILRNLPAPVYATRLTLALIEHKLREHRIQGTDLRVVSPGDVVEICESFTVEFMNVSHSIAGAVMLAIKSPVGTVIFTGDFKIDYTPIDDQVTDLGRLAQLGREGVLLLMADSTNVERAGYTMSEKTVGETFMNLFNEATGRVIVAMFASNVHRVQQVVDSAVRYNRKVCLVGRSMINISKVAMQLGELKIPEGRLLNIDDLDNHPDNEIVVITTGSQGEPMSGLARMAFAEHKKLEIKPTDMVIVSATPIPGNEKSVSRVINQLVRTGANVIYEAIQDVHVSGHACQEELKLIHVLAKPRFFIPVHGEYRHLHHHARLARQMGMPDDRVKIVNAGDIIEVNRARLAVVGSVPSGEVLIDGLGIGDVGAVVLRDRKHLSQDGLLVIIAAVERISGMVVSGPEIISRGFVYMREADSLVEGTREAARAVFESYERIDPADWNRVKAEVRDAAQKYIYDNIKRSPMILPVIVEI